MKKHYSYVIFFFSCALLTSIGCTKRFFEVAPVVTLPLDTSIILWKNPKASTADFDLWKQHHNITNQNRTALCPFCNDDNLELYEGLTMQTFIQGGGGGNPPPCPTPPCGPQGGGDDTVYYTYNFPMNLITPVYDGEDSGDNKELINKLPSIQPNANIPDETALRGNVVSIGIFDTGVDPSITTKYTKPLNGVCDPVAASGWNYSLGMPGNNDTRDDYTGQHGTTVAKFIVDQVLHENNQPVNIIPIKIHDSHGSSSLFSVLCGFAFAAKSHINIINASFGFYWHDFNHPPSLLSAFVKTYLTKNGILLIAAAGNKNEDEDNLMLSSGMVSAADMRDLKKHPFYPAELAGKKGFGNVIAVTTVFTTQDQSSPVQNYSKKIVDFGVNADHQYNTAWSPTGIEFGFIDPLPRLDGRVRLISGSSYATPIITGKIAAHYDFLTHGMGNRIDKSLLISRLQSLGLISTSTGTGIPAHIKNGKYAVK